MKKELFQKQIQTLRDKRIGKARAMAESIEKTPGGAIKLPGPVHTEIVPRRIKIEPHITSRMVNTAVNTASSEPAKKSGCGCGRKKK